MKKFLTLLLSLAINVALLISKKFDDI